MTQRVLLVEDNPGDARLVQLRLRSSFEVTHAHTLQEGIDADKGAFVAALIDVGLPDATGIEVVTRMREAHPSLPLVVLTGLDDDAVGEQSLREGAQDYLVKDDVSDAATLARAVRYAIERKNTENLRLRLHHADRLASIGQLAAGVAHEVNNPATFLLANTDQMRDYVLENARLLELNAHALPVEALEQMRECNEEMLSMLGDNLEGIERIRSTVRDLGSFSRVDQVKVGLVDVNEVAETAINLTRNQIKHRATFSYAPSALPKVHGIRGRLAQVIVNLIINAAQAIEGEREDNRIELRTRFDDDKRELVVEVQDTGAGIPQASMGQLFEPFFTTKPQGQGTGLGLSLCLDTVEQHGGRMEVESELGQGSVFA